MSCRAQSEVMGGYPGSPMSTLLPVVLGRVDGLDSREPLLYRRDEEGVSSFSPMQFKVGTFF